MVLRTFAGEVNLVLDILPKYSDPDTNPGLTDQNINQLQKAFRLGRIGTEFRLPIQEHIFRCVNRTECLPVLIYLILCHFIH